MNNNQQKQPTTTQIRNFYSDGVGYINTQFFDTNFSIQFVPFVSKDNLGKSTYNKQGSAATTLKYEGAYALFETLYNINAGKEDANGVTLNVPCTGGASLILERKASPNNTMETWLTISKNGVVVPFRFSTIVKQVNENGKMVDRIIEVGIGALGKTLNAYLEGINEGRHLDKLTEEYVKSLSPNSQQQNGGGFQTNSGYQKRPYNNYQKKPYNPNYNNNRGGGYNNTPPQQQSWQTPVQTASNVQGMSNYNLPQ